MNSAELLLDHVRVDLGFADAAYSIPPLQISGGYDTEIFRVCLHGASPELEGTRVLRAFPAGSDHGRARQEAAVQNALAAAGLPVPRVHLVVTESRSLEVPCMVMDYVEGETLLDLGEPQSSRIMGETHAMLHSFKIEPVVDTLAGQGITALTLPALIERIALHGATLGWAGDVIRWLRENQPTESGRSISHGDFHKLNIMQQDGRVTGILDWSGFAAMEAAFDVANTRISFLILARHLTEQGDFEPVDLDAVVESYLDAYDACRRLDDRNLNYYLVLRATMILFLAAARRAKPYRHPLVVADTCRLIEVHAGVRMTPDAVLNSG